VRNGQIIKNDDLKQMQFVPLEPDVVVRFILNPKELNTVLEYVDRGNLSQFADRAFVDELTAWIRFNQKEALATLDGLYSPCSDRFGYQVGISESTDRSSNSAQAI
jgi:hypothetical protein